MRTTWINTTIAATLVTATSIFAGPSAQAAATPDYWECSNRVGGEWSFGRAPNACEVTKRQTPLEVKSQYPKIFFDDTKSRDSERVRYMNEIHALIREVGMYYIKKRDPGVGSDEIQAFIEALYVLANQESYWSHYRLSSDQVVRYMRGDFGHGHGMMQVDDRAHYVAVTDGKGIDLVQNMIYGLDVFYSNWVKSASASCVSSKTDWRARTRSAWAAYNGGPSKLCRWTNPNDRWAANDKNFYAKLTSRSWTKYVSVTTMQASIDVKCMAEGTRPCLGPAQPVPEPIQNALYKTADAKLCVLKGSTLECVSESRDLVCLEAKEGRALGTPLTMISDVEKRFEKKTYDRTALCGIFVPGLIAIGTEIEAKKNINVRQTPGGNLVTSVSLGATYRILDFEVQDRELLKRYYKVRVGTDEGFVYSGDHVDWSDWVVARPPSAPSDMTVPELAKVGGQIEIVNSVGINLRATPGGTLLTLVPKAHRATVLAVDIRGNESSVYYKITYSGKTGYVFSGALLPKSTVLGWTKPVGTAQ